LAIDLGNPNYPLTGEIISEAGSASLTESVAVNNPKNLLPAALKFTASLHMPAGEIAAHGFAAVNLGRNSTARIVGQLADGTPYSVGTAQSRDGTISWTTPLYRGAGWLLGHWTTVETPGATLGGSTRWLRTSAGTGFDRVLPTDLSLYVAPSVSSVSVLDFSDSTAKRADVALRDGGLQSPVDITITFLSSDVIQPPPGSSLRLTLNRASGIFAGSLDSGLNGRIIRGAILQDKNQGYGFFLNHSESGSVELLPQ
jgi:hypothetical protein